MEDVRDERAAGLYLDVLAEADECHRELAERVLRARVRHANARAGAEALRLRVRLLGAAAAPARDFFSGAGGGESAPGLRAWS